MMIEGAPPVVVASVPPPGPATEGILLPPPVDASGDGIAALSALFAEANRTDSSAARADVERRFREIHRRREDHRAALEAVKKAAEGGGLFDGVGLVGIVALIRGSPVLVLADVAMHVSRTTPDFVRDLERAEAAEVATKIVAAGSGNVAAAAGLALERTQLFGRSSCIGTLMVAAGSPCGAAPVICADKDSDLADQIRTFEKDTEAYNRWIGVAGMAVAGAATIVATLGTATAVVVAIGLALSAAGCVVSNTKVADGVLGRDGARWTGAGLMLVGSVTSGVGAGHTASTLKVLETSTSAVTGAAKIRQGLETIAHAAVSRDTGRADAAAREAQRSAERLERIIEDIIEEMRGLKESHGRVSAILRETIETTTATHLAATRI
jgi:hypothetical protein